MTQKGKLIGLIGAARSGKDAFAEVFYQAGYTKQSPGMYIKKFYDDFTSGVAGIPEMRLRIARANPSLTYDELQDFIDDYLQPFDDLNENISAFTEDLVDKEKLRSILEIGGEVVYEHIFNQYLSAVDELLAQGKNVLNPRVATAREAREMMDRDARFFSVYRPGYFPVSRWESDSIQAVDQALSERGVRPVVVDNGGSLEDLQGHTRRYLAALELL